MLKKLVVKNYALIKETEVIFDPGLNIITGETGAGKSILMDALGLALGERADFTDNSIQGEKSVIEAEFDISALDMKDWFLQNDFDYSTDLVLRRELLQTGKSRIFINDTPAQISQVKDLASLLVDIHSQQDTIFIRKPWFALDVIDTFAGLTADVEAFSADFRQYKKMIKELQELDRQINEAKAQYDYHLFLLEELKQLQLEDEEFWDSLEQEINKIDHAEEILLGFQKILQLDTHEEYSISHQLTMIRQTLANLSKFNTEYSQLADRFESVYLELKDILEEIERLSAEVEIDPEKAAILKEKHTELNRLLLKHQKNDWKELLQVQKHLEQNLIYSEELEEKKADLEKRFKELGEALQRKAGELHQIRINHARDFEKQMQEILHKLNFTEPVFKLNIQKTNELFDKGYTQTDFLFSANKGLSPSSLAKVASGGEKSRLMLAIKYMLSGKKTLPVLILDEIDTGISGDTAAKVASFVENMAKKMQVIVITHLPQMASKGQTHFMVSKQTIGDKTISSVKKLNQEERILCIAGMISGDTLSEAAIENAKVLLINK
ncbi:MAG: DNA repair protein RecN [Vicingaceae bacterium]|nr:MAG: DNA repair protein RecN [Vicingaceae bacterium]